MRREAMENGTKAVCQELRSVSDEIDIAEEGQEQLHKHGRLSLFESRFLPSGIGRIAFVGGPVSALDFHPWAKGICAIAAHRSDQQTHKILKCYEGSAHIQLWRFSKEATDCIGVIAHTGDCVWDLKWRPDESDQDGTAGWGGTLAAALGDGTVLVCYIDSFTQTPVSLGCSNIKSLSPKSTLLRVNKNIANRSPVRVVEWSKDGNLLVAGAADGSIEVYDATSVERTWPRWSIPGHESVVMDLRWLSDTHLCSLGLSCVLRLRDIRDPVSTLEQNMEGLSGSLSMDTPEPNVAVVGGDYGYLRVVRLSGADGVLSRHPVKRVRLQAGSFRDMRSIPVSGRSGREATQTLLYTGGTDGMLHECKLPRPIWESAEQCELSRTRISEKLRWELKRDGKRPDGEHAERVTLHLHVGKTPAAQAPDPKKQPSENGDAASEADGETVKQEVRLNEPSEESPKPPVPRKASTRKSRALGRAVSSDVYSLFGSRYNQSVVITRIGLSGPSDMLAAGISGGVVTWMDLSLSSQERTGGEEGLAGACRPKVVKPPRKRGRPRKFPILPIQPPGEPTTEASFDVPRTPIAVVVEEEKAIRRRGRPRQSLAVFGPKRKRGRPKKVAGDAEEKKREPEKRKRTRKVKAQGKVQRQQAQAQDIAGTGTSGGISDDAVLVVKDIETAGVLQVAETTGGDGNKGAQGEHDGLELEILPASQKAPGTGRHGRQRRRPPKGQDWNGAAEVAVRKEDARASGKPKARAGSKDSGKAMKDGESGERYAAVKREKESKGEAVQKTRKEKEKGKEKDKEKDKETEKEKEKKASGAAEGETMGRLTRVRRSPRVTRKGGRRGADEEAASVQQNRREEVGLMMTPKRDVANSARTRRGKKRRVAEEQDPIPEIAPAAAAEKRSRSNNAATDASRSAFKMQIAHPAPPQPSQHANTWPDVATPPPPSLRVPKTAPNQQQEHAAAMDVEVLNAQPAPATLPFPAAREESQPPPATNMETEPTSPPPQAPHGKQEDPPPSPPAPSPPAASRKRQRAELESGTASAAADAGVAPDTAPSIEDVLSGSPSMVASQKRLRVDDAQDRERPDKTNKSHTLPPCPCRLRVAPARKDSTPMRLRVRSPAPTSASEPKDTIADAPRRSTRTRVRCMQDLEQPAPRPPRAPRKRSVKLRLRISEPVALTDDSDMDDEPRKSVYVRLRIRPGAAQHVVSDADVEGSADAPAKAAEDHLSANGGSLRKANGAMDEDRVPPVKTAEAGVSASAADGERQKDDHAKDDEGSAPSKAAKGDVSTAGVKSRKNDVTNDDESALAKAAESNVSAAGGENQKDGDGDAAIADANGGEMDAPAAAEKEEGEDQPAENGITIAEKDKRPVKENAPFSVPDVGGRAKGMMEKAATALISMGAKNESANVGVEKPDWKVSDIQPRKADASVPAKHTGGEDEFAKVSGRKPDAKVLELQRRKALRGVSAEVEAAKAEVGKVEGKATDAQTGKDTDTTTANASEAPPVKKEATPTGDAEQTTEGSDGDAGRARSRRVRKPSWKVA